VAIALFKGIVGKDISPGTRYSSVIPGHQRLDFVIPTDLP
jgi:hypothetical protein